MSGERASSSTSRPRTARRGSSLHAAPIPSAALLLGHGAGGGVGAPDLRASDGGRRSTAGVSVALVEQPYRVAGRRAPAPAHQLDAAWLAVAAQLRAGPLAGLPLLAGGRSSGARVACRTAEELGAVGVLCLAFPLRPVPRAGRPQQDRSPELDARAGSPSSWCRASGTRSGCRSPRRPCARWWGSPARTPCGGSSPACATPRPPGSRELLGRALSDGRRLPLRAGKRPAPGPPEGTWRRYPRRLMAGTTHAAVTPTGIRDGEPAALAALVERRANAVLAYCETVLGPQEAERAAAEAFARFRAAVATAADARSLDPEMLLLGATRHAAARPLARRHPGVRRAACGVAAPGRPWRRAGDLRADPGLLAGRAEGALSEPDRERLARHLEAPRRLPGVGRPGRAAEQAYAAPPERTVPTAALTEILLALTAAAPVLIDPDDSFDFGIDLDALPPPTQPSTRTPTCTARRSRKRRAASRRGGCGHRGRGRRSPRMTTRRRAS